MTNILKQFPNLFPLDLQTFLQYWNILDPNILLLSKYEVLMHININPPVALFLTCIYNV